MPYLRIQTNKEIDEASKASFLDHASKLVAEQLGKPESYVMVDFAPRRPMRFAGRDDACAYLELKSIGLPETRTRSLSEALCGAVESELGVPADRVYIEFADAPRAMWGWNKGTF